MIVNCPVCNSILSQSTEIQNKSSGRDGEYLSCQQCGDFFLTRTVISTLANKLDNNTDKIAILSHSIRKMQRDGEEPFLDSYLIDQILKRPLPSTTDQANNLILWLGDNVKGPGETVWIQPSTHQSVIGAKTPAGFAFVLHHLYENGLITGNIIETLTERGRGDVTLSFEGWRYFDEIKRGAVKSRKAFMAMQFGDPELDNIVDNVFKPALLQTGFELYKLNEKPKAGLIDDRMRVEIRTSRLLIADLTHENAGAYWEAGFAEGLGKPVIYTCEKDKFNKVKTHFDTNHHLTIKWDKNNPDEAAEELKATIRATLPDEASLTDD